MVSFQIIVIKNKFKAEKLFQYIVYRLTCMWPPSSGIDQCYKK